jgi:hypothetical protein
MELAILSCTIGGCLYLAAGCFGVYDIEKNYNFAAWYHETGSPWRWMALVLFRIFGVLLGPVLVVAGVLVAIPLLAIAFMMAFIFGGMMPGKSDKTAESVATPLSNLTAVRSGEVTDTPPPAYGVSDGQRNIGNIV